MCYGPYNLDTINNASIQRKESDDGLFGIVYLYTRDKFNVHIVMMKLLWCIRNMIELVLSLNEPDLSKKLHTEYNNNNIINFLIVSCFLQSNFINETMLNDYKIKFSKVLQETDKVLQGPVVFIMTSNSSMGDKYITVDRLYDHVKQYKPGKQGTPVPCIKSSPEIIQQGNCDYVHYDVVVGNAIFKFCESKTNIGQNTNYNLVDIFKGTNGKVMYGEMVLFMVSGFVNAFGTYLNYDAELKRNNPNLDQKTIDKYKKTFDKYRHILDMFLGLGQLEQRHEETLMPSQ